MAEAPVIASAIAIPEPADLPKQDSISNGETPAPGSLKRRQSSTSDTDSKRRRLSIEDVSKPDVAANTADATATSPPRDERRKSRQVEERKRGQRLFGALLGTLSQGTSNAAQKRRADIEKRQQDKLKRQDEDDEVRRRERLENLKAIRRKEQVKYEERTMRLRHKNLLQFAKFLRTKTEPRLYYKPWELTRDQEDEIQDQIDEAQRIIDDELDAYEARRARAQEADTRPPAPHKKHSEEPPTEADKMETEEPASETKQESESRPQLNADTEAGESANTVVSPGDEASAQTHADDSSATAVGESVAEEEMRDVVDDEQGETVVEAEEDTVIY